MANTAFNRAAIMARAWAIFAETYNYPRIPFAKIGRACFAWALKKAWSEAKEAARIAAIPTEVKAARVERLREALAWTEFSGSYAVRVQRAASLRAEIASLSA